MSPDAFDLLAATQGHRLTVPVPVKRLTMAFCSCGEWSEPQEDAPWLSESARLARAWRWHVLGEAT